MERMARMKTKALPEEYFISFLILFILSIPV